ncbi:MAG: AAA family ATPase [Candidatus Eisenbacteria bacterium]|nr:AAA family ATPase [Candidatus Eisenbacteria bacterium]
MKLLRLKADGFGPLRGEYPFDPDKVTLVVDRNETGKSSLLSAVGAALYGLEGDKRSHRVLTPLERWRPWDGGSYRVELEFENDGERFTVRRDFERGTVEVWNARGQEVTPEFREGKDDFPVGKKLFGLDVAEFEKCALVRQHELDLVVPADEKARRATTLHARLENAADTRGGDTNAAEALQVLEGAARKYTCAELEFTGTVETAIQRLDLKLGTLGTELNTLEHDLAQASGPLAELARLADEEQVSRTALDRLEAERRAGAAAELKRALAEIEEQERALARLRAEAEPLAAAAHLPANAEADLRETIARHAEAQRNLETLEARRREEQERERRELETAVESLKAYAGCGPEDADRLVALAAEVRRVAEEEGRLRGAMGGLRETLTAKGYEPARIEALTGRFDALDEAQQKLLAGQAQLALAYQTDVARLEAARTAHSETLREIDAARSARRLPGLIVAALGAGAAVAGGTALVIQAEPRVWAPLLAGGGVLLATGLALLAGGSGARSEERETALRGLTDAQRQLNQLKTRRAESEVGLAELARALGYRDGVELMRDRNEHQRLMEESGPVLRAQEQLSGLEGRRRAAFADVRAVLDRAGGGPPDPAHLERVAAGIRHLTAVRQRLGELDRSWSWIDDEKRVAEAAVTGLHERAVRILQSAGLAYDPEKPWAEQVQELAERAQGRARWQLLTDELIPQAERRLPPAPAIADLRRQLAAIEAEAGGALPEPPAGPRPGFDIERDAKRHRELLELIQRRRADLRVEVEDVVKRANAARPELLAQQERIERALERARRFKRAVELACTSIQGVALETHRRWAEFLNRRVTQLLETVGTQVEDLRFGEDLDFSVKLWNGQQIARGKAVLQLSAGARDQLWLAIRLAISEYLSRPGCPLPLLMDDVFATSDDERARAGMRLLIEYFARQHQVILATCHRHRHEKLAALDPELWAAQVHWLDARAASLSR